MPSWLSQRRRLPRFLVALLTYAAFQIARRCLRKVYA